jgi:hypothetical protein
MPSNFFRIVYITEQQKLVTYITSILSEYPSFILVRFSSLWCSFGAEIKKLPGIEESLHV